MIEIKILNNQSFFDISIQLTGTPINAFLLAQTNEAAVTDSLEAGSFIRVPEDLIIDRELKRFYDKNKIVPGTALTQNDIDTIIGCEGIGCWQIGIDFTVS